MQQQQDHAHLLRLQKEEQEQEDMLDSQMAVEYMSRFNTLEWPEA